VDGEEKFLDSWAEGGLLCSADIVGKCRDNGIVFDGECDVADKCIVKCCG